MGRFGERIGSYEAIAANLLFSTLIATTLLLLLRQSLAGFGDALHSPWWYWVGGGGMGVVVVFTITVVTPQIGATATIGLLIAGQLAMGVLIDRYGWFGVEQVPLNWPRIVGVLLLAVGALLALASARADDVVGADRDPRQLAAGRVPQRRDDRRGRDHGRRLADALDAVGRVGLGVLDQLALDRRHVERGRDQVVGEARVRDQPVARPDLLHQRQAEPLCGAALDLPLDGERVDRLADVLRGADPDDAREAEVDVHLGDDPHRRDGEGDVGALARDLAGLGVEGGRPRMAVDALDVDIPAGALLLLERGPARIADRPRRHPGHPRG